MECVCGLAIQYIAQGGLRPSWVRLELANNTHSVLQTTEP